MKSIKKCCLSTFSTICILLITGCGGSGGSNTTTDTTSPGFTTPDSVSAVENQLSVVIVQATDVSTITYSIAGGDDSSSFSIDSSTGELTFNYPPDFENPTDANADNVYVVIVKATDSAGNEAQQIISITVTGFDVTAPSFTSGDLASVAGGQISVITVQATDTSTVTYSIAGGDDASSFSIDSSTGELTFNAPPDYDNPADANADNVYIVIVKATDVAGNEAQQQITVTILKSADSDNDYIPDDIEISIGTDPANGDENANGVLDGLDTEGSYGDDFFDKQWHIRSLGTQTNNSGVSTIAGNDLGVLDVYHDYMGYNGGSNIIVSVVDSGVDADHEDLVYNMDLARSYNNESVGDPSSPSAESHGTEVAGIMAATAFNGKGVRGIIPFAKIAGSNWLDYQTMAGLEKVWLSGNGANEIAVTNNSWGDDFSNDTTLEAIMALGTSSLRDGKGRVYVFAGGNSRADNVNANHSYELSNRYPIAVAALKHDNTYASYSNPGSNILVSGYGGNLQYDSPTIGTTYIAGASSNTWSDDLLKNYTFAMNGTSAAAPTVSAAVALTLEACPDLTWRDVKYLIAKNATQVDTTNSTWVTNSAGFKHSIDYGFGLVNTKGMIDECTSGYSNLSAEINKTATATFNTVIPDNNTTRTFTVNMPGNITVEWVEVTIDNDSTYAGDYRIELTSPNGTKTQLINPAGFGGTWMDGGFRLSSVAMLDEKSIGSWKVAITDEGSDDIGTLKTIKLKVYGH